MRRIKDRDDIMGELETMRRELENIGGDLLSLKRYADQFGFDETEIDAIDQAAGFALAGYEWIGEVLEAEGPSND